MLLAFLNSALASDDACSKFLRVPKMRASCGGSSGGGAIHVVQAQRASGVFNEQVAVLGCLVKEIFIFKIVEVTRCAVAYDVEGVRKQRLGAAGDGGG